jgi:hypothetical protein
MAAQQHLGEVVQQRGQVQHGRVVVHAMHGEAEREVRAAVRAPHHPAQPLERLRLPGEQRFHAGRALEGAEEGADAHHHQRGGDRLRAAAAVGRAASGGEPRDVGHQLERHQRVAADRLGELVRIDVAALRLGARQQRQLLGGGGLHRDRRVAKARRPGGEVVGRTDRHGRRASGRTTLIGAARPRLNPG